MHTKDSQVWVPCKTNCNHCVFGYHNTTLNLNNQSFGHYCRERAQMQCPMFIMLMCLSAASSLANGLMCCDHTYRWLGATLLLKGSAAWLVHPGNSNFQALSVRNFKHLSKHRPSSTYIDHLNSHMEQRITGPYRGHHNRWGLGCSFVEICGFTSAEASKQVIQHPSLWATAATVSQPEESSYAHWSW